jgi:hypothetical protein
MDITETKIVNDFIVKFDQAYAGKLSKVYNFPRVVQLATLNFYLESNSLTSFDSVAVVSGSLDEPELNLFKYNKIKTFNFSEDRQYDLDNSWDKSNIPGYDFVICNQVLEHVFNPHQAFKNLISITNSGGYIFVSIPTINRVHGEPYFYSSGYHSRFLTRLGVENNLKILDQREWGSVKYLLHTVSGYWPTFNTLKKGVHNRYDLLFPFLTLVDGTKKSNALLNFLGHQDVTTDCWALFQKC